MATERPMFLGDCPRCGASRTTFDLHGWLKTATHYDSPDAEDHLELIAVCRSCWRPCQLELVRTDYSQEISAAARFINHLYRLEKVVSIIPNAQQCPEHVPLNVKRIFDEGAMCLATSCFDAAGTMFRKVLDSASRPLLPPQPSSENKEHPDFISWKIRKDLALRLEWLFKAGKLPISIKELATCVREDGNDAAHTPEGIRSWRQEISKTSQ